MRYESVIFLMRGKYMKEKVLLNCGTKEAGGRVKKMRMLIILSLISYLLSIVYLGCSFEAEDSEPEINPTERPSLIPGDNKMEVRWTKIDTAIGYEIYYATAESGERYNWKEINPDDQIIDDGTALMQFFMTNSNNPKTDPQNILNWRTYWVWLKAIYPKGTSEFSEGASGTPIPAPWDPVAIPLTPQDAGDKYFKARWEPGGSPGPVQFSHLYYTDDATLTMPPSLYLRKTLRVSKL